MAVQEQKTEPRVHRMPPRRAAAESKNAAPPPAPVQEEEAPVAVAVPLDSIGDDKPGSAEEAEDDDTDLELIGDDEDEEEDPGPDKLLGQQDDDDDEDLSILEEGAPTRTVVAEEEAEEGFLEVYSEDCLQCKSLVPFAKKKFKGCHFSAGNKHCPASDTTIVIRVPLEDIVPRFMSAERANDFNRLARLNAKLAEKPDWFQERVARALREARAKQ